MFALRALLPFICLLHVVSATPTGTIVRRVDGDPASDSVSASASSASASAPSSSASSSPDADAFLQNHFTIDQSCTRTGAGIQNGAKKQPMLEQAVKDAAILLHEAQSIQRDDPAVDRYFLPQGVGDEDDFDTVQKMFTALLNPTDKITITCPLVKEEKGCSGTLAITDTKPTNTPTMRLCPSFFTNGETTPKLEDKSFDVPGTGWCEAPYRLGNWMTGAHTIIHEMTHFSMIGVAAGLGDATSQEGTTDVLGKPDENDDNMDTYGGGEKKYAPIAAIALRQHWIDYLAQPKQPDSKAPATDTLKEPPVGSTENAESYAATATEFFFAKKCALGNYDGTNLLIIEP